MVNEQAISADMILDFSGQYPNLQAVEDLLGGVNRKIFPDGTHQFIGDSADYIYSPRLPENELEVFCGDNIKTYQKISEDNGTAVLEMEDFKIEPFWEKLIDHK